MSEKNPPDSNFMTKLATFIVDKKTLFFLLYIFAVIFCAFSSGWVNVENDVTTYLPEDTETRQGIVAMNDNFTTFATAQIMVSNVTYETAEELSQQIEDVEGVSMVTFDDTPDHYTNASALFDISFDGVVSDEISEQALSDVEALMDGYDYCVYSDVGYDENATLQGEMTTILIVAVVIIIVVLTLTSRSYAEVPVLMITFGVAAILNMGTNFQLGTISFISNSVAVVLQLALAIDYAIILCHRFTDERETRTARDACITALSKAIPEISASSLTTVSGLAALGFMEFKIGLDMALVLVKAILFSLLSVFTLMPGLLMLFSPLMDRTRHRKLLPNITPIGKFAVKTRRVVPPLFAILLVGAFILSNRCPFVYSYNNIETANMNERQTAYFKIQNTFGTSNMVALVVPSGNYDAEVNIVLFGILKHGDHVVTTVTEHNAVLRPLFALEKAGVITISVINPDRNLKINPCHVAKTIKENTALVALNAVSNVTGVINDFEKIGRIAAERKVPLLLDAAQALPHVKINMKAQNISYLAGAGHKGLHGPQGTGFLALNKMSDINPLIYGGTGTNSDSVYQPHNLPESLEAGTLNAAGIVGLCESVKWTIKNADKINAKISRLSGRLMFALKNMRNVEVYTPVGVDTGVISFNVKDADSTTVADILDKKYGIAVRAVSAQRNSTLIPWKAS